jgi:hypothetical protein
MLALSTDHPPKFRRNKSPSRTTGNALRPRPVPIGEICG